MCEKSDFNPPMCVYSKKRLVLVQLYIAPNRARRPRRPNQRDGLEASHRICGDERKKRDSSKNEQFRKKQWRLCFFGEIDFSVSNRRGNSSSLAVYFTLGLHLDELIDDGSLHLNATDIQLTNTRAITVLINKKKQYNNNNNNNNTCKLSV
jgi:hypothetical protein